jgi:hypothetical protein
VPAVPELNSGTLSDVHPSVFSRGFQHALPRSTDEVRQLNIRIDYHIADRLIDPIVGYWQEAVLERPDEVNSAVIEFQGKH